MKAWTLKIYRALAFQPWFQVSRKWGGYLLKGAVTFMALAFIANRLMQEREEIWQSAWYFSAFQWFLVCAAACLIPINLGFEAAKWQAMAGRYYPGLRMLRAFQAVLAGIATGIFTPNRVGEYAGRILYLQPGRRLESVVFLFVDRICQMGITVWTGTLAMEYLLAVHGPLLMNTFPLAEAWLWGFRGFMWFFSLLGIALLLFPAVAYRLVSLFPRSNILVQKALHALAQVNTPFLLRILGLSLVRYGVFSLQYYLLLLAFGYEGGPLLAFHMVGLIFLIKSIIPSVSLTELGIRESVAIAITGVFAVPAMTAFASTFVLYFFNIILPALIGLVFVLRIRLE